MVHSATGADELTAGRGLVRAATRQATGYGLPSLPIVATLLVLAIANGFYLIGSAIAFSHSLLWPDHAQPRQLSTIPQVL